MYSEANERALRYADSNRVQIVTQIGGGVDGVVLETDKKSAIKAHRYPFTYQHERDAYLRLTELEVQNVNGFNIPRFIGHDDELLVIEMEIVTPPFVLDFAAARFQPSDYPEEVLEEWEESRIELFGVERWGTVCSILSRFRAMGIHLHDVKPGNITFEEEAAE